MKKHLVDELVGADRAAYRRQLGVRWVAADEVALVKALELGVKPAFPALGAPMSPAWVHGRGGKRRA